MDGLLVVIACVWRSVFFLAFFIIVILMGHVHGLLDGPALMHKIYTGPPLSCT